MLTELADWIHTLEESIKNGTLTEKEVKTMAATHYAAYIRARVDDEVTLFAYQDNPGGALSIIRFHKKDLFPLLQTIQEKQIL